MRRFTCLLCAIVSAIVLTYSANATAQPAVTTERLADGVYLLRAPDALDFWTATNSVVIVNDEDVVVVDIFTGRARRVQPSPRFARSPRSRCAP